MQLNFTRDTPKPCQLYLILVGGEQPVDLPDGYLLAWWDVDHWVTQMDSNGEREHIPNDHYDSHLKVVDVYAWAELPSAKSLGVKHPLAK